MSFSSDIPLQSNQLELSIDFPEASKPEFRDLLSLTYKRITDSVNFKEGGLYQLREEANFQRYFPNPSNVTDNTFNLRSGYRTTFDLVYLNGAPIPSGITTPITLTSSTQPTLIPTNNGVLIPTDGWGAATIAGPKYFFINDPLLYVRFNNTVPGAQVIEITNNTGSPLTQCYWVFHYLKVG